MKALLYQRSISRFAAAKVMAKISTGLATNLGPLSLSDIEEPKLPGKDWQRVYPLLSGICGSDLSTIGSDSSRYFEPIVSFPFVPGHELVGEIETDNKTRTRVVIEPVLSCSARGISPLCPYCEKGETGNCQMINFGHISPGLQTGYCSDTGGGWSGSLVAHKSQIHLIPPQMTDEQAVMVEPTACGVHAALSAQVQSDSTVVIMGAGTMGLTTLAALKKYSPPKTTIISAKYDHQRKLAKSLGADIVTNPTQLTRSVRLQTKSLETQGRLNGGADIVIDCVGNSLSLNQALKIVRPKGKIVLVGMPGQIKIDLAPLWQREISLIGAYAYGSENLNNKILDSNQKPIRSFDLALELVMSANLERLVSTSYPLDRFEDALDHATNAGPRGAIKIVFDLRQQNNFQFRRNS